MKYSPKASRAEVREQAINIYMGGVKRYITAYICHLRLSIYFNAVVPHATTCGLDFKLGVILTLDKNKNCITDA